MGLSIAHHCYTLIIKLGTKLDFLVQLLGDGSYRENTRLQLFLFLLLACKDKGVSARRIQNMHAKGGSLIKQYCALTFTKLVIFFNFKIIFCLFFNGVEAGG